MQNKLKLVQFKPYFYSGYNNKKSKINYDIFKSNLELDLKQGFQENWKSLSSLTKSKKPITETCLIYKEQNQEFIIFNRNFEKPKVLKPWIFKQKQITHNSAFSLAQEPLYNKSFTTLFENKVNLSTFKTRLISRKLKPCFARQSDDNENSLENSNTNRDISAFNSLARTSLMAPKGLGPLLVDKTQRYILKGLIKDSLYYTNVAKYLGPIVKWLKTTQIYNLLIVFPIERSLYGRYKLQKQSLKYRTPIRQICKYIFIYVFSSFSWFYLINYTYTIGKGKEQFTSKKNGSFFSYFQNENLPLFQENSCLSKKETIESTFFLSLNLNENIFFENKKRFQINFLKNNKALFCDLKNNFSEPKLYALNQNLNLSALTEREKLKANDFFLSQDRFSLSSLVSDFSLQNFYGKLPCFWSNPSNTEKLKPFNLDLRTSHNLNPLRLKSTGSKLNPGAFKGLCPNLKTSSPESCNKQSNNNQNDLVFYARQPLFFALQAPVSSLRLSPKIFWPKRLAISNLNPKKPSNLPSRSVLNLNASLMSQQNQSRQALKRQKLLKDDIYRYSGTSMILHPEIDLLPRQLQSITKKKKLDVSQAKPNAELIVNNSIDILAHLKPQVQLIDQLQWFNYIKPLSLNLRQTKKSFGVTLPNLLNLTCLKAKPYQSSLCLGFSLDFKWQYLKEIYKLSKITPFGQTYWPLSLSQCKPLNPNLFLLSSFCKQNSSRKSLKNYNFKSTGLRPGLQIFLPTKNSDLKEILIKSRLQSGFIFPDAPIRYKDRIKKGLTINLNKDLSSCQNISFSSRNRTSSVFQEQKEKIDKSKDFDSRSRLKQILKFNKLENVLSSLKKIDSNLEFPLNSGLKEPFVELTYKLDPRNKNNPDNQKNQETYCFKKELWGFDFSPRKVTQVPDKNDGSFNKFINFIALDKYSDLQRSDSLLVKPELAKKITLTKKFLQLKQLCSNLSPINGKLKHSFSKNKEISLKPGTVNQKNYTLFVNKFVVPETIHPLSNNSRVETVLTSREDTLTEAKIKQNRKWSVKPLWHHFYSLNSNSKRYLNQDRTPEGFFGTPYLQLGERFTIEKIKSKNQIGTVYNIHNGSNSAIKLPYASAGTSLKTVFGKKWLKQQSLRKNSKAQSPITTARLVSNWQITNISALGFNQEITSFGKVVDKSKNLPPDQEPCYTFDQSIKNLENQPNQVLLTEKGKCWPLFLAKGHPSKNTYLSNLFDFKRISSKVNKNIINPFKYYNPGTKRERNIEDTTLTLEGYKKSRLFSKLQTYDQGVMVNAIPITLHGYSYSSDRGIDYQSILGGMRQRTESQRTMETTTEKVKASDTLSSFDDSFPWKQDSKNSYQQKKTKYRLTNRSPLGTFLVNGSQKSFPEHGCWPNSLKPISEMEYNFNPQALYDQKPGNLNEKGFIKGLSQTKGFYFEKIFNNQKFETLKFFGEKIQYKKPLKFNFLDVTLNPQNVKAKLLSGDKTNKLSPSLSLRNQGFLNQSNRSSYSGSYKFKGFQKKDLLSSKLTSFGFFNFIPAQKPILKSLGKILFFFIVWSSYKTIATPLIHSTQFLPAAFTEAVGLQSFQQKYRIISKEKTKETFKNLAGAEKTLAELRGLIWTFRLIGTGESFAESFFSFFPYFGNQAGQKRDLFRFKERTKFLLIGPPGTGKTLLVKALAAEAKVPIIVQPVSGLQMISGVENPVSALFHVARQIRPCIIFLDELDTLGNNLYNSKAQNAEQKLGAKLARKYTYTLLLELDGLTSSTRDLLIIGATNRPETLNSALTRAGRFETIINCNLPTENQRFAVLSLYLDNFNKKKTYPLGLSKKQGISDKNSLFRTSQKANRSEPLKFALGLDLKHSNQSAKGFPLGASLSKTKSSSIHGLSLKPRSFDLEGFITRPSQRENLLTNKGNKQKTKLTLKGLSIEKRFKVKSAFIYKTPWEILFEKYSSTSNIKEQVKIKNKTKEKIYLAHIVEKCYGLSQASLATIANESALIAMTQEQSSYQHTLNTLDKAIHSVRLLTDNSANSSFFNSSVTFLRDKEKENNNSNKQYDPFYQDKTYISNTNKDKYTFLKHTKELQASQKKANSSFTLKSKNLQSKVYTAYQITGSLLFPHLLLKFRKKLNPSVNFSKNELFRGKKTLFESYKFAGKNIDAGYASLNLYSVTKPQNSKLSKGGFLTLDSDKVLDFRTLPFLWHGLQDNQASSPLDFINKKNYEPNLTLKPFELSTSPDIFQNENNESHNFKNASFFGFQEKMSSQIKTKNWLTTGWFRVYLSRPISRYDNKEYIENKEYYPQNQYAPCFRRSRSINISTLTHRSQNLGLRTTFDSFHRLTGSQFKGSHILSLPFGLQAPGSTRIMEDLSRTKKCYQFSLEKAAKNTSKAFIPDQENQNKRKIQYLNIKNSRVYPNCVLTQQFLYLIVTACAFHERLIIMEKNQELIDYCVYNILRYGVIYNFSIQRVSKKF